MIWGRGTRGEDLGGSLLCLREAAESSVHVDSVPGLPQLSVAPGAGGGSLALRLEAQMGCKAGALGMAEPGGSGSERMTPCPRP